VLVQRLQAANHQDQKDAHQRHPPAAKPGPVIEGRYQML
jgi:hypothetical protein